MFATILICILVFTLLLLGVSLAVIAFLGAVLQLDLDDTDYGIDD